MKTEKLFVLLILIILSTSCNVSSPSDDGTYDISYEGVTEADFDVIPNEATTFETNLYLVNFVDSRETKIREAMEIVKLVIGTEEFKDRILNHRYNGAKTFVDNGGFSNAQIYKKILDGAERLQPARNNTMDAEIELYTAATNVVGYTYPSSRRIWVNTKYFDVYTPAGVAHNLMHEWMHKLGFDHAQTWNSARDYSVPYAIGNIVGDIGRKFL